MRAFSEAPELNFAFFRNGTRRCLHHEAVQISKLLAGFSYRAMRLVHYIVDSNPTRCGCFVDGRG
jgi:hypothetical protein